MGNKALLIIDGTPRAVAVGATQQGVKVLSLAAGEATVEVNGQRIKLLLGGSQVNLGGTASAGTGNQIVLTAGPGGHFVTAGAINGRQVRFMVDTGATLIGLSQSEADRIGLDYKNGPQGYVQTANGPVLMRRAMLASVRINDVQVYNVEAMVTPSAMNHVLLGNSFLTRFQMRRENDRMTLDKRP